jgi:hypothetical protein
VKEIIRKRRRSTSPPLSGVLVSRCSLCRVHMKREKIDDRWQHIGLDGTIEARCLDPKAEWDEKSS